MPLSRKKAAAPAVEDRDAALWRDVCETTVKAQTSLRIEDGLAARRAWAAWINESGLFPAVPEGVLPPPLPGYSR